MIRYASSETLCRNQFLLGYFGQIDAPKCGRCDVCIEKKKVGPGSQVFKKMQGEIENLLAGESRDVDSIVEALGGDAEQTIGVLEQLLESGVLVSGKDLKIGLK